VTDRLLSGWARTAPTRARVVAPSSVDEITSAVAAAGPRGVVARGLGRAYGDAAQNAGGLVLDLTGLRAIEAFDPRGGTAVVQAGASLGRLMRAFAPHGWLPAVLPGTRHVTVGGAIACDVHGKSHHVDGAFCRHVTWLDLVTPDAEVRRLTPTDDAFWATAGGMGLTGIVTRAALRLAPAGAARVRVTTERAPDLDTVLRRLAEEDGAHRHSIAWLDCAGRRPGRGVIEWGDPLEGAGRVGRARPALPLPPVSLLDRRSAVRALNAARFRAAPARRDGAIVPAAAFHQPLDAVPEWNRLFGRRGLTQHQVVVPFGAEDLVRRLVHRIGRDGGSALTTLKRFGPADPGPLSFPAPGWALAFDLPAGRPGLAALLDEADEQVAAAGGRVYLAKDARLRPDLLAAMYPRLDAWRATQRTLDPDGRLCSDLGRRLGLVTT
jgi:decaprenylphospho-beta-D-ribofuranose 2-oxidase